MSAAKLRVAFRWMHIFVGGFVGAYFYSPLSQTDWALPLIKFALIPALVVSGVVMWKQPQIMRLFRGKGARQ